MKIRKLDFNQLDLRDDEQEPIEEWEPPNYYYHYTFPDRNQTKNFRDLDAKLKAGLENMAVNQYECLGRFGIWPDWGEFPDDLKQTYKGWLHKWGHTYKNAQFLYADYVRCANSGWNAYYSGGDIIDPSERNKLYYLTNVSEWVKGPWDTEEHLEKVSRFPNGSVLGGPVDVRKPENRKSSDLSWTGTIIRYSDKEGVERMAVADVSMNSRTLKRRK